LEVTLGSSRSNMDHPSRHRDVTGVIVRYGSTQLGTAFGNWHSVTRNRVFDGTGRRTANGHFAVNTINVYHTQRVRDDSDAFMGTHQHDGTFNNPWFLSVMGWHLTRHNNKSFSRGSWHFSQKAITRLSPYIPSPF